MAASAIRNVMQKVLGEGRIFQELVGENEIAVMPAAMPVRMSFKARTEAIVLTVLLLFCIHTIIHEKDTCFSPTNC